MNDYAQIIMSKSSHLMKLERLASQSSVHLDSREFAEYMDSQDELSQYREQFVVPTLETLPRGE